MFTRPHDPPEHRFWINTHPMRNGVSMCSVNNGSEQLREFTRYDLAERYRWWVIAREYKRLAAIRRRDAATVTAAVTGQPSRG